MAHVPIHHAHGRGRVLADRGDDESCPCEAATKSRYRVHVNNPRIIRVDPAECVDRRRVGRGRAQLVNGPLKEPGEAMQVPEQQVHVAVREIHPRAVDAVDITDV
jgi:hypothetical protein